MTDWQSYEEKESEKNMWIEIDDRLFNMSKVESIRKYDEDAIVFHYENKKDYYIGFINQYSRNDFYRRIKKALEITASRELVTE